MNTADRSGREDFPYPVLARDLTPSPPPSCPVCGEPLGQHVILDVLSLKNGGAFRLSCNVLDKAHCQGVPRDYEFFGFEHAIKVLHDVGEKAWADPDKVFRTLWPWLRHYRWERWPSPANAEAKPTGTGD